MSFPVPFFGGIFEIIGLTLIAQTSKTTAATATLTLPAEPEAGDLLVIVLASSGGAVPATVTPTGFTNQVNVSSSTDGGAKFIISTKIADGTEDTVTTYAMMNSYIDCGWVFIFRPNRPITSVSGVGGDVYKIPAAPSFPYTVDVDISAVSEDVSVLGFACGWAADTGNSLNNMSFPVAEDFIEDNVGGSGFIYYLEGYLFGVERGTNPSVTQTAEEGDHDAIATGVIYVE